VLVRIAAHRVAREIALADRDRDVFDLEHASRGSPGEVSRLEVILRRRDQPIEARALRKRVRFCSRRGLAVGEPFVRCEPCGACEINAAHSVEERTAKLGWLVRIDRDLQIRNERPGRSGRQKRGFTETLLDLPRASRLRRRAARPCDTAIGRRLREGGIGRRFRAKDRTIDRTAHVFRDPTFRSPLFDERDEARIACEIEEVREDGLSWIVFASRRVARRFTHQLRERAHVVLEHRLPCTIADRSRRTCTGAEEDERHECSLHDRILLDRSAIGKSGRGFLALPRRAPSCKSEIVADLIGPSTRVRAAVAAASKGLVEREVLAELIVLAAVAGEHLLVIGPPGTAKSEVVRRVARALAGRYFEYLLGRFTEPSEIFGPIDLRRLKEGVIVTETRGMLPEADIAFLDEIFLGSTAILNTLLAILNERTFRRGHQELACPLRVCVGASNTIPEDESLAAFADRFLVRAFVDAVPDHDLEDLLAGGWSVLGSTPSATASLEDLDVLSTVARAADLSGVRTDLAQAVRTLRANGISLSDRRAVKMQRLVAAAAALAGREVPGPADLWPILYAVPAKEEQHEARDLLRQQLSRSENGALPAAAQDASLGPQARAQRILAAGRELIERAPDGERGAWLLKLEGVAREIDACFTPDTMPSELAALRERIVQEARRTSDR
jgi:MoxR-like ATPase